MTTLKAYVLLLLCFVFYCCQFTVEGKVFGRSLFAEEHELVSLSDGNFEETKSAIGSQSRKIQEAVERRRRSAGGKQPLVTSSMLDDSDRKHNEAIVHWSGKDSNVSMKGCAFFRSD